MEGSVRVFMTDISLWWSAAMCLSVFDSVYIARGIKTNGASYQTHRLWHFWVAGQRCVRSASSQSRLNTVCVEFHMLAPWLHKAVPWLHKPARDQRLWTVRRHSPIRNIIFSLCPPLLLFLFSSFAILTCPFSVCLISRCDRLHREMSHYSCGESFF